LFDAGGGINVSKAISRLEENHTVTSGGSTGDMLKSFTRRINFFEAIETEWTRKISLQLMTMNSQFRFVFRHHPLQSLKR
jgi:fructose-1-phosphate kinase PfkB-like protein